MRRLLFSIALLVGLPILAFGGIYAALGRTPAMAILVHGGAMFVPISPLNDRLSPSVRRVLAGDVGTPRAGDFTWRETEPGFAVAEVPVLVKDSEVDRLLLAKADPARFRLVARNDPWAVTTVDGWMRRLDARLVVNGSYYAPSGLPDTPFVANGRRLGPDPYDATQGALVSTGGTVTIRDLAHADWHAALAGADEAMVSYPLLLDADGKARPIKASNWLANRTFVGLDAEGWIVIGTTADAYFSLQRLAAFLASSPLGLRATLNLDGGPVSCQALRSGTVRRDACGEMEVQSGPGDARATTSKLTWLGGRWALPIALAVVKRP